MSTSIWTWSADEIERHGADLSLPIPSRGLVEDAVARTKERIERRLVINREDAIRFGTFSYLLEVLALFQDGGSLAQACAVEIAEAFVTGNSLTGPPLFSHADLLHFASVIKANSYDWEGLLIAYLDAEAVQTDRLRRNLGLSPSERVNRHQQLVGLLKRARRV